MSRTLPTVARDALWKSQGAFAVPVLIEISHDDLATPIRVVNNNENLTYNGNVYLAYPFQFDPPDETEDKIENAKLVIDNIAQDIMELIRSLTTAPTIKAVAAFWKNTDGTIDFEPMVEWEFTLASVTYDVSTIQGELVYEDRLDNEMGPIEFRPQWFPGVQQ